MPVAHILTRLWTGKFFGFLGLHVFERKVEYLKSQATALIVIVTADLRGQDPDEANKTHNCSEWPCCKDGSALDAQPGVKSRHDRTPAPCNGVGKKCLMLSF